MFAYIPLAMGATGLTVFCGVGFFLLITLLLVAVLLIAKKYLVKTGKVVITMNARFYPPKPYTSPADR